jgi:hypothetical protein
MSATAMAIVAVLATGAAGPQAEAPAPGVDRFRPRPDVYYPPLPPAPVQPATATAPGAAQASPAKPGCRMTTS